MTPMDFIYLNVPGLLRRYTNPSPNWHDIVCAHSNTQLRIFQQNSLINPNADALKVPINEAVVRFSDLTAVGQAFVKSGAIERWLSACDRKQSVDAYRDGASLQRRFDKFLYELEGGKS